MQLDLSSYRHVLATMTRAERAVSDKLLRQDLRAAAKAVLPVARELTPTRTGKLRRSLAVRAVRRSRIWKGVQLLFLAGKLDLRPGQMVYAHAVEHGVKRGPRRRPGVLTMRRAFDRTLGSARTMIESALRSRWH